MILFRKIHMLNKILIEIETRGEFNILSKLDKPCSCLPVTPGQEDHGSHRAGVVT